jgi:hypothetical protein
LVDAVAEQASILRGDQVALAGPPEAASLEEICVRADSAALLAERDGSTTSDHWSRAAREWARLGMTVFLARAQARAGDVAGAESTLRVIGAADEGRAWALQR